MIPILLLSLSANGQTERYAFTESGRGAVNAFVTDYHALGINPANLAFGNEYKKKFTLGLGQVSFTNYGEGFNRNELRDAITGVNDELSIQEQFRAAERFRNSVLSLDASVLGLGFAVNTEKAGNFAFSAGARFSHYSKFNATAADHLWRGFADPYFDQWVLQDGTTVQNGGPDSPLLNNVVRGISTNPEFAASLYNGSRVRSVAYTEYNLGYGRQIVGKEDFTLNAGVGVKYLQGFYVLNVQLEDNKVLNAFTASSPGLDINYGSGALSNPSAVSGTGFKPVGSGMGFDLGLSAEVGEKLRISASITDIGSITFDGNVYQSADTVVFDMESIGITSYNVFNEFDVFAGDDGLFKWEGKREQKVNLPTQLRFGLGYFASEKFRLGLDVALPLNEEPGNMEKLAFALGADFIPTRAVRISGGLAAGESAEFRIPLGLTFVAGDGAWEAGFATRDALYFIRSERPNLSIAMGFLRFRFGNMDKGVQSRMFN